MGIAVDGLLEDDYLENFLMSWL